MDYFSIYKDVWQFHKQYIDIISGADEIWENVVTEADRLCKKYENARFVRDLIMAKLTEFERMVKINAE